VPIISSQKKSAEAKEDKFRLAADDVPEKAGGFVAVDFAKRFAGGGVEQVHEFGVVACLK